MTFRYRRLSSPLGLDPGLDMTFGRGGADFIIDSPEAVAQSVYTRLCLWQEEWYLDLSDGTPWMQQILTHQPNAAVDAAIRERIYGTPYVTRLYDYSSFYDPTMRTFTISCKIITAFGEVTSAPPGAVMSPSGAVVMSFSQDPGPEPQLTTPHRFLPPFS
jgi:hypothetical protein